MSGHKAGGYVEMQDEERRERKSLYIILQPYPGPVLILTKAGHVPVLGGLGFQHDGVDALNAKRGFAAELYEVSKILDEKIINNPPDLDNLSAAEYEQTLDDALTLTEGQSLLALDNLRDLGRGLRDRLDRGLVTELKRHGFPHDDRSKEPALTFANDKQAPVLWEMMYEEEQPGEDVDWQHFWGFRIPITHWEATTRPDKILLKKGLFSGIDQTLDFANSEVTLLAQQLKSGLQHRSLSDAFREQVNKELCKQMQDNAQVEAWFASQDAKSWLNCFLLQVLIQGINEAALAEHKTRRWKEQTIRSIFNDPHFAYELIHFACHCEPSDISELLTKLNINIAGEEISLNVASMANEREWGPEDPGPLVFLNACGTGAQGATTEPPGFPENWIKHRGALAVIATLCPVPDLFAHAFALKFYSVLFRAATDPQAPVRHRYLGEALLETRRHFMDKCKNPLGLAYVLYAVKDAYIENPVN
jgi:CHAT domain